MTNGYTPDILNQNSLFLILAAPATAWVAGMGLYKTLLVMVIMHRWIPGGEFSGPLAFLGQDWALYLFGGLGIIELVVDMVPRLDIQWGRWNVHLRIVGAVALTWMLLIDQDVFSRVLMSIIAVALAVTSYTATTSARRAAIRGNTAPFVSPVSSVTEDCLIASTLFPLTQQPPLTLLLVLFMTGAAMLVIYVVRDETRETFRWIFTGRWIQPQPRTGEDNGLQDPRPAAEV